MEYSDEQILMRRRQMKEQEAPDISTPNLLVGGEALNFERMELFDRFFSAMLPKEYKDMSENLVKLKYPMESRPQSIKTSADTAVNICFSKFGPPNPKFAPADVEEVTKLYFGAIRKTYPTNQFHMQEIKSDRGYFSFTSPGFDQDVFQLQAFISIKDTLVHFIFNSPDVFRVGWAGILPQVIDSIQAISK
jgi:hypothetical protein